MLIVGEEFILVLSGIVYDRSCFQNLFSNSSGTGPIIVLEALDDPAGVFAIGARQFGLL